MSLSQIQTGSASPHSDENPMLGTSMRQVTEELQTGLPSPPSIHTVTVSSSPSASLIGSHPQLDLELKKPKSRQDVAAGKRRGKTREDIHATAVSSFPILGPSPQTSEHPKAQEKTRSDSKKGSYKGHRNEARTIPELC